VIKVSARERIAILACAGVCLATGGVILVAHNGAAHVEIAAIFALVTAPFALRSSVPAWLRRIIGAASAAWLLWVLPGLLIVIPATGAVAVALAVAMRRYRVSARIGRHQQEMSDRLHAKGDKLAAETGWTVTTPTGRLGFGARRYRNPRFDQSRRGHG
jgi:hypothetical protein